MGPFRNRAEAGKYLGVRLREYTFLRPLILALPRGGLPVAAAIADQLHAELDVLAVKKIGAPRHPEVAMGAISEYGEPVLDEDMVAMLDPQHIHLNRTISERRNELQSLLARFRAVRPAVNLRGRAVILVDDGLATGSTMEAAVRVARERGAARVIVAVPVAAPEACAKLEALADDLVALVVPGEFYAVGTWYEDFSQVTEFEAVEILGRHQQLLA